MEIEMSSKLDKLKLLYEHLADLGYKEEASKILEEAKSEKIRIISEAENQAKTNKKKVEAEIKLASQKATNSIKQYDFRN